MRYRSANDYMRHIFGYKVYKISINGGFTCPNRDGSLGVGGCIFCSGEGSGDFSEDAEFSVNEQIEEIKAKKKYHNFMELLETNDIWEVK